jgi:hypothetical protein
MPTEIDGVAEPALEDTHHAFLGPVTGGGIRAQVAALVHEAEQLARRYACERRIGAQFLDDVLHRSGCFVPGAPFNPLSPASRSPTWVGGVVTQPELASLAKSCPIRCDGSRTLVLIGHRSAQLLCGFESDNPPLPVCPARPIRRAFAPTHPIDLLTVPGDPVELRDARHEPPSDVVVTATVIIGTDEHARESGFAPCGYQVQAVAGRLSCPPALRADRTYVTFHGCERQLPIRETTRTS